MTAVVGWLIALAGSEAALALIAGWPGALTGAVMVASLLGLGHALGELKG